MKILLLLLTIPAFLHPSVFSSMGFGEYVDFGDAEERGMGGVRVFSIPKNHSFDVTFLADFIRIKDGNRIRDDHSFSLHTVNYFLPLDQRSGIAISLTNILSTNYYIRSEETVPVQYERIVSGKGGIGESSVSLYRRFLNYSLGIGGLFSFGRTEEIWETVFPGYRNTVDTLISTCSEHGVRAQFAYRYKNTDISIASSHYFNSLRLVGESSLSVLHHAGRDWKIGGEVNAQLWNNFPKSVNIGFGIDRTLGFVSIRGGVFSRSWYYNEIHELGASAGLEILYPDALGSFSLGLEVGTRGWKEIEERFMRLSFTLLGTEIW